MKQDIRIIDVFYTNGDYATVIIFSAPDHKIARMYYESLRIVYTDFFVGDSILVDVNFSLVKDGKLNPEIERLNDFIPIDLV